MGGMFDMARPEPVQLAQSATPEQIKAAAARLMARGITPTKVNLAEEIAVMTSEPAAPAVQAPPGAGRAGPQGSAEMLARIKAEQEARNQVILRRAMEERRRMSGAR